jgi:hypothetical protein
MIYYTILGLIVFVRIFGPEIWAWLKPKLKTFKNKIADKFKK